jgi:hypothetical protein
MAYPAAGWSDQPYYNEPGAEANSLLTGQQFEVKTADRALIPVEVTTKTGNQYCSWPF